VQNFNADKIRNIVLLSHPGAGKTSLAEAILFNTGAITRLGKVSEGNTVSDFEPEEIKRKISINLSVLSCTWKDMKFNVMDTPGYPDFVGEVLQGITISDGAMILVDGAAGVEVGTETQWAKMTRQNLPAFVVVNKMDRENANFVKTLDSVQKKLSPKCVPIQIPIGAAKDFKGIIDILNKKAYSGNPMKEIEIPEAMKASVEDYYNKMVEAVIEVDDALVEKYLEGQQISHEQVLNCLRKATDAGKFVPVMVCSALNNEYITPILDAIHDYMPSPLERAIKSVTNAASSAREDIPVKVESPLCAYVFKTTNDTHIGRITFFKVFSGEVTTNIQAWNSNKGGIERVGQISTIRGKTQEVATKLTTGDIGSVAKLSNTVTGDTLATKEKPYKVDLPEFPDALFCMAVNAKAKADLDKMSSALPKICEEDMTLKMQREADTGELMLCGIGETHLEVSSEKLTRKFGAEIVLSLPKIPYKETINTVTQAEYKHKKQTGGHGQYGHVFLEMEPKARGEGFEFAEKVVGGSVPRNYIPAVEKGVNEARMEGILAKYPVVDMKVTLTDGSFHPVDSSEMAFKIATLQAFKKGMQQGNAVLLEPIVNLTITVPDNYTGDIIGDMNSRGGRVIGMIPAEGGINIIQSQVPQAAVQRYAIDLRSMTQGRGTFKTEFSHYQEVPAMNAQKIIAQKQKEQEQEK
jgi:elongation factor G